MNRNFNISIPEAPLHPLSSAVTILMDNLWSGATDVVMPLAIPATMAITFTTTTISVTLTQKFLANDSWGSSLAKGFAAGVVAGVPFSVTGTAGGAIMLGWSGLAKLLPAKENELQQLPPPQQRP